MSYFQIAALVYELSHFPDNRSSTGALAARMRLTPHQLTELLERSEVEEFLSVDGDELVLSERGGSLAASITANLEAVAEKRAERYRPYDEYLPRRWWPDSKND